MQGLRNVWLVGAGFKPAPTGRLYNPLHCGESRIVWTFPLRSGEPGPAPPGHTPLAALAPLSFYERGKGSRPRARPLPLPRNCDGSETFAKTSPLMLKGELKGVLDADRASPANCAALPPPLWMDVPSAEAPDFAGMT